MILHEKGGKVDNLPCLYTLEEYLQAYLDGSGLAADRDGPLFRSFLSAWSSLLKPIRHESSPG